MKTGHRAIPLDAAKLKTWLADLTEKAVQKLVSIQWKREDEGETEEQPLGTWSNLASDVISVVDVRGETWDVPVNISARPGKTPGPTAGGNHVRNMDPLRDGPAKEINLWMNGRWTPFDLQREKWELVKQLQSMFLHEMTHAMDYLDHQESLSGGSGDPYFNQPHEVRAYGRQIVDDVVKAYKVMLLMQRRLPPGHTLPTGQKLVEDLLDQSPTWVSMGQRLNAKNQRLIRQMVVRELQDAAGPDRALAARVVARYRCK